MSTKKISKKIIGYAVKRPGDEATAAQKPEFKREQTDTGGADIIRMH